jgi:hypothetical protein
MKLTTRLKRGRKTEWWVLEGGKVRTTVAEVVRELVGGVEMMYRPYLHLLNPSADGEPYTLRQLAARHTLEEAVEVVRAALEPPAAVVEVNDRVTFVGVGMTPDRAAKFANAMSRKIAEEPRP